MISLRKILNIWFYFTLIMLVFTLFMSISQSKQIVIPVFFINLLSVFGFFVLVNQGLRYHDASYYSLKRLMFNLFLYSIIFVLIYNMLYYVKTGTFFEFSAKDTLEYDYWAREINRLGVVDGIKWFFQNGNSVSDLGAPLVTSLAYLVYPSTFMFNLFNLFAGLITARVIYKLSILYMDRRYAYFTALIYGLSSFVVYLYSTGMKESFFVMFIALFFSQIVKYYNSYGLKNLVMALVYLTVIFLFRPAVTILLASSVLFALIFTRSTKGTNIFLLFILIFLAYFFYSYIDYLFHRNYPGEAYLFYSSGLEPTKFNYITSFLSGMIGPLPTYFPIIGRLQQSFYSVGLSFRVFISVFFWLGFFYSLKKKNIAMVTLSVFSILEIVSLSLILESFELRLDSPHLVPVYIVSFYFLYLLNTRKIINVKLSLTVFKLSYLFIVLTIFVWNLRFI